MQRDLLKNVSHATSAAYFYVGVVTGVLHFESAKAWAFSVIEALDVPPIAIIDAATAGNHLDCCDALSSGAQGGDLLHAGSLLFADILSQLNAGTVSMPEAIEMAMRVASVAGLPEECVYALDAIEDELKLAIDGVYGTLEQVRLDLIETLCQYADR
jgi:hypothetical protein